MDQGTVTTAATAGGGIDMETARGAGRFRLLPTQIILVMLSIIAFLYFARPVMLPIILACAAAMTLKPLVRWAGCCHIPPALSAAVVLCLLMTVVGIGFFQLSQPASRWVNDAPQHMT